MSTVFIALGSNLGQPEAQLRAAVNALRRLEGSRIKRISSVYSSPALGPGAQPDYLNAVLQLSTTIGPLALLDALQQIEQQQGRRRDIRWGPRTLDLDILLFGQRRIDSPRLTVPHPALKQRNFVLYPLAEISGEHFVLPDGTELGTLLALCPRGDLARTGVRLDHA